MGAPGWRGALLGHRMDAATATFDDWRSLPGVGRYTAESIIATRRELGGFEEVAQLRLSPGVGASKMKMLRPWLRLGP